MSESTRLNFSPIYNQYSHQSPLKKIGKVTASNGLIFEVCLPKAVLGSNVEFITEMGERSDGEIVGIKGKNCFAMPYEALNGINSDTQVILKDLTTTIRISPQMLGRVVDFQGRPIDKKGPIEGPFTEMSIYQKPPNPLERKPIEETLDTGIRSINCFLTLGKGQRVAIMAGSGVGKSVLLGMIARNTSADINVIALIGERGREVREFIEHELGEEGLKRSVIVVATSDESPLIKIKAAFAATTIAEYFRDQENDVMIMMDSITRLAMAQREIGLSAGEPPGQKGFPPSVFTSLPKILERAGTKGEVGSITGIYSVLVEGGDMDEPISDAIRAIADGHIILDRDLAAKNHFPAIDVLSSISRIMNKVVSKEHRIVASHLRDLMAAYKDSEDLINVGAYVKGTNMKVDKAIHIYTDILEMLQQEIEDATNLEEVYDQMVEMARKAENAFAPIDEDEGNQGNLDFNMV